MNLQKNRYFYLIEELSNLSNAFANDKNIKASDQLTIKRHTTALRKVIDQSFNLF